MEAQAAPAPAPAPDPAPSPAPAPKLWGRQGGRRRVARGGKSRGEVAPGPLTLTLTLTLTLIPTLTLTLALTLTLTLTLTSTLARSCRALLRASSGARPSEVGAMQRTYSCADTLESQRGEQTF